MLLPEKKLVFYIFITLYSQFQGLSIFKFIREKELIQTFHEYFFLVICRIENKIIIFFFWEIHTVYPWDI